MYRLFRSGEVNFMIVTDLAARGIDVPLLDNVINFHFPFAPKLFVHRCGRAARQGRIGYAFSLVEPEELAYAMDVHIFLNKTVDSGYPEIDETDTAAAQRQHLASAYSLTSMKPSMVHTGIFPQDVLAEEIDSLECLMAEDEELRMMWRVCVNGMKQYRRTRSESTRSGIKEAKRIAKHDLIRSIHPLIAGADPDRCSVNVVQKANFIRHLQTFRPAQTVFESGIGTGVQTAGSKTGKRKAMGDSYGVEIMRALRKELAPGLERPRMGTFGQQKGNEQDEEGPSDSEEGGSDGDADSGEDVDDMEHNDEYYSEDGAGDSDREEEEEGGGTRKRVMMSASEQPGEDEEGPPRQKVRLSRAARKQLKKGGGVVSSVVHAAGSGDFGGDEEYTTTDATTKSSKDRDFVDKKYYMSYGTEDEVATFIEDAYQPMSGLKTSESMSKCNAGDDVNDGD
jgi:superfamily II DNA/RNA helicase